MGLNQSKGNMYEFIDATWNTIKGECPHGCTYCYMKKWGKQNPVRFDKKELETDLGSGNFIFVGSSCDMFAKQIPTEWIKETLLKCEEHDNKYFFQSKNPKRFIEVWSSLAKKSSFCTTIETNRVYSNYMGNAPEPWDRAFELVVNNYITIEPIMDFDLIDFLTIIKLAQPRQVNIGADSGGNNLPEPTKKKTMALIEELEKFTTVVKKKNLKRIIGKF